jgi:hypothetical protein
LDDEFDDDSSESDVASEASGGSAILFLEELDSAALLGQEFDWPD